VRGLRASLTIIRRAILANPRAEALDTHQGPRIASDNTEGDTVSDLKAKFEQAVADSKNLPERPDNQTLLKLYALYKQASTGDVEGKRPGFTDMVGRAKWDAWSEIKGTSNDDAMKQYVSLIDELKG
jgi:diazepam-binding inhibitor (GABA receptor modulating acyl-CoA-binding protein)